MNERWLKMCSMLLVMCMIFNMLPMGVFAQEVREDILSSESQPEQAGDEEETSEASDPEIVAELADQRTEFSKTFRMDNGLTMTLIYPDPIHYEKEGEWADIDNTLVAADNGSYTNTDGIWDVSFPEQLDGGNSVVIEKDGYTLSFSMAGQLLSPFSTARTSTMTAQLARASEAQIQQKESAEINTAEQALEKLQSRVSYNDVYENTDIVYDLESNKVKESVILESYNSALQGYRYILNVGEMTPVVEEDGQISFYDPTGENLIMVMPAPFLVDDANVHNYDVEVNLSGSGSRYILTYLLPQQWLAAEDRAWPVVLDPIVTDEAKASTIDDRTVAEVNGTSNYKYNDVYLKCGYQQANGGIHRTYLKYDDDALPQLNGSKTVVRAELGLFEYNSNLHSYNTTVEVHKVTESWTSSSITWNTQPAYDSRVEDYCVVGKNGDGEAAGDYAKGFFWNITGTVRDWYSGTNNGVMLKATDAAEASKVDNWTYLRSSDSDGKPVLYIYFRHNSGIESHFSYQTMSAGHAGSAYISDSTGQLNVVKQLASYSSTINPFNLNMVYNSNFFQVEETEEGSVQDVHGVDMQFGKGITWDMIQSIEEAELENAYGKYLVWHDGDGTDHYFLKQSDGKYLHEDGRDLTVTKSGNQYTMTDDQGNKWLFDNGLLYKYQDESGNTTVIQWQGSGSSRYFYRIYQQNNGQTTGTDLVNVTYTSGSYINTLKDAAGRVFKFEYTGGKLTSIKMENTPIAQYTYATNGLQEMQDKESGYKLCYTYDGNNRITSYQEKTATGETGALAQITYYKDMTVYRDCGADRQLPSSDDLLTYYSFDYWGKTVNACTKDTQGKVLGTSTATYTQNKTDTAQQLRNNNRVLQTASTGMAAQNLLLNGSFESDTNQWTIEAPGSASITQSTYTHHSGSNSLQGYIPSGYTNTISAYCSQTLTKGKQYTFSAYVDTSWISSYGSSGGIRLLVSEPNVTQWVSKTLNYDTTGTDGGWVRLSVTFTAGASVSYAFMIQAWGMTGWFYADDFQLEEAEAPSNYNLIQNSNMQSGDNWLHDGALYYATETGTNNKVLSLQGSLQQDICAWQNVRLMQPSSQTYVLSGWGWADSVPDNDDPGSNENYASDTTKRFGLQAILHYLSSDETDAPDTEYHYVPFNPDVAGWQFAAMTIVPKQENRTVHYIQVVCAYEKNANVAWFDNLSLTMEAAQSMRYDAEGNLVSVTTTGLEEAESTYDNGNLIQTQTGGFGTYTYTYDKDVVHRLLTATDGVVEQNYGYDSYGNVNSTTLNNGNSTMRTSASYTSKGNLLGTATDANGNQVWYYYDTTLSKLTGAPTKISTGLPGYKAEDTNKVWLNTETAYDNFGRETSFTVKEKNDGVTVANPATIGYTYNNGNLTNIERTASGASQNYVLGYDVWGNKTSISVDNPDNTPTSVGDLALATYTYADKNGNLESMTYGNKDKVEYTYDNLGRVTKEVYSDYQGEAEDGKDIYVETRVLIYTYTGDGQLYSVHDSKTEITQYCTYDALGRVVASQRGSMATSYEYDEYARLVRRSFTDKVLGDGIERYTYDATDDNGISDGMLTSMRMINGSNIAYSYDALQRLTQRHINSGKTGGGMWDCYIYKDSSESNTTTTQIHSKQNWLNNSIKTNFLFFEYDGIGNITKETRHTYDIPASSSTSQSSTDYDVSTIQYTYDNLNQLTKVTHSDNTEENYTYDNAGNIKTFNNGSTQNHTLAYEDTRGWKDLLTKVDNETITYDKIGNPLTYYDGYKYTFTWTEGRRLASSTYAGQTTAYEYDYTGLRTKKINHDGTYTVYHISSGRYVGETQYGADNIPDRYIRYVYDENDSVVGISLWKAGYSNVWTDYYFEKNLQGDVIAVYTAANGGNGLPQLAASYTYDAWGNIVDSHNYQNFDGIAISQLNPFRYRGYYFDNETWFYYLQSRYYDPAIGRFINADGLVSTGQGILGHNMFAYCGNNPVNYIDPSGSCFIGYDGRWYHDNWEFIGGYERKPDPRTPPTSVSEEGLQFIADYETYHQEPYDDGYGNLTIGYGHVIKSGETFSYLTEEDAKVLLKKDLLYWENEVAKYSAKYAIIWDQNEFDAFVSLACNSGYTFQSVMDLIIDGEDPHTAFSKIIYAGGNRVLGLYRRRMDEADMYVSGIYKRTYREWQ